MIIIRLQSELESQLFQYAFGRALSVKLGEDVKFNASMYLKDKLRNVEIISFQITMEFASRIQVSKIRYGIAKHLYSYEKQKSIQALRNK